LMKRRSYPYLCAYSCRWNLRRDVATYEMAVVKLRRKTYQFLAEGENSIHRSIGPRFYRGIDVGVYLDNSCSRAQISGGRRSDTGVGHSIAYSMRRRPRLICRRHTRRRNI
jgi:hypothetical protein